MGNYSRRRLPSENNYVLVSIEGSGVFCHACCLLDGFWKPYGLNFTYENITHWMPLPEPPKQ